MAMRRMFSNEVTDSDAFVDMPLSSQALYFHLGMVADDDGFINNPKKIQRGIGASNDDMALLVAKGFVIAFESGVAVIKHWRINNFIRKDRRQPTKYQEEYATLYEKTNGAYSLQIQAPDLLVSECPSDDGQVATKCPNRLGKDRLGKDRLGKNINALARDVDDQQAQKETKHKHGHFSNVLLTDSELTQLQAKFPDWRKRIDDLSYYIGSTGKSYKSHYRTILSWDRKNAAKEEVADGRYSEYRR